MIFSKRWSRWIFSDVIKFILFFMVCIYFVFFTVDLSIHGNKILIRSSANIFELFIYYYHIFIIYLNLFLCLALMLAIIKVVCSLNTHSELIALQMGGLSIRKLSIPIFVIAFFATALSYINYEYLIPNSTQQIEDFKNQFLRTKKRAEKNLVNTIFLQSGSKIIYQKYDSTTRNLFDVFFIKSQADMWHAKYLAPYSSPVQGRFVDHFQRNNDGTFQKTESFVSYTFSDINFDKTSNKSLQPYESRPISTLFYQFISKRYSSSVEKAYTLSQLNYKLAMPLLPMLTVFVLVPVCSKFSRSNTVYIIFSLALIFFIGFYTLMDGVLILAENRVASSFLLIWTPIISCLIFFGIKFLKGK